MPGSSATETIAVLLVVGTGELGSILSSNNKLINVDLPAEKCPTKVAVYCSKNTFLITWFIIWISLLFFDFSMSLFNLYKISSCFFLDIRLYSLYYFYVIISIV